MWVHLYSDFCQQIRTIVLSGPTEALVVDFMGAG